MNKVWLFCLLIVIVSGEYPRFKHRGPSPSRSSQISNIKKWPQQPQMYNHHKQHMMTNQRPPSRVRHPALIHMPFHKMQIGAQSLMSRPISAPVRNIWKNTQTTYNTPPLEKKKPQLHYPDKNNFQTPSTINAQEYDFNLRTNVISNQINTINQIGEKGPIRTIPAPNLSLADKPIVMQEASRIRINPETSSHIQIQKSHQYHVTEVPEQQKIKFYSNLHNYGSFSEPNKNSQVVTTSYQTKQPANDIYIGGTVEQPQIAQKELYQVLNNYPQEQPYNVHEQSQTQYVSSNYDMLFAKTPQLFQAETTYPKNQDATDKVSIQPEYHSFNYEEQRNKEALKKGLISNTYYQEPQATASEPIHATLHQDSGLDTSMQSQLVQSYFDTRQKNANNVEPDAKSGEDQEQTIANSRSKFKQENDEVSFYVSLPNKETADSFASLQSAGKINSNLMYMTAKKTQPTFAEQNYNHPEQDNVSDSRFKIDANYEDYLEEHEESLSDLSISEEFGHKLKPKQS